ncbi:MAG: FtsX-like permease family protein [Puia sp.]|nr:FtsX-like permease family protein [Puia sp.]
MANRTSIGRKRTVPDGNFIRDKFKSDPGKQKWAGTLFIQRFADKYLHNSYENGKIAGGRIEYVRLFSLIAAFLLVIACINFMNLSTAKASNRMKEVGVRKCIGASRRSLIAQYLGESMLMASLSLLLAIGLVWLLLPAFKEITGKGLVGGRQLSRPLSLRLPAGRSPERKAASRRGSLGP